MRNQLKLFMVLLGSKAPARNVEQHDFYFGIGEGLKALVPQMREFWPEAGSSLHIDGWREITNVDNYRIDILENIHTDIVRNPQRLFFINLGGYTSGRLEEQHYTLLSVHDDRVEALKNSKTTEFFKTKTIRSVRGANAHIDEKYGIDVDEIYRIEDLLSQEMKERYSINLVKTDGLKADEINLGYFKLERL